MYPSTNEQIPRQRRLNVCSTTHTRYAHTMLLLPIRATHLHIIPHARTHHPNPHNTLSAYAAFRHRSLLHWMDGQAEDRLIAIPLGPGPFRPFLRLAVHR